MTEPKPYQVANWIADEIQEEDFIPLRSMIEATLKFHLLGKSEESIAELSEELEAQVFEELGIITDQLLRTGTEPSFFLEGDLGSAYIKVQNANAVKLLSHLKNIDPIDFEKFCADILVSLGGTARHVGKTNDGGVDFIATDIPISNLASPALRSCFPLVIGQAKRYGTNLVTVTDLRGFMGGALLIADDIKRQEERYGLYSPVIYAFWTTSNFNIPARAYSTATGLWCLGGLALTQLAFRLKLKITNEI